MLNIPSSVKALFQADGVHKNFRVHFPNGEMAEITNDNVVQESVKFTESLCSQSTFKFGLAEASVLEFETVGIGNMYGMTIQASCEIDCSSLSAADKATIAAGTWDGTWDSVNEVFAVPYGTFRVDSCPRDHQSMAHRQVTAYTDSVLTPRTYFPQRMLWSKIHAKTSAVRALASGGGLVQDSVANFVQMSAPVEIPMYDSSGRYWLVRIEDGDDNNSSMFYKEDPLSTVEYPSFERLNFQNFSASAYDAFGVAVANALASHGVNLTYNKNGSQRYSSNEEALRYSSPWLFSPCVFYSFYNSQGIASYACVQKIRNNTLIPLVYTQDELTLDGKDTGFVVEENKYTILTPLVYALVKNSAGSTIHVKALGIPSSTVEFDLTIDGVLTSVPTGTRYTLDSYYGDNLIQNTGESKFLYGIGYPSQNFTATGYNYDISASGLLNLYQGAVELAAEFSKADRNGSFEAVRLDPSSPMSIVPGNYTEAWWDEIDVEPIGSVVVTYRAKDENGNDQENTTTIEIGSGSSVYDMSNNEALKGLGSATYDDVVSLVKASFAPYVGTSTFTPIELSMQGWPWLEAGDALEIEAEDGTTVETYALRVEMSGIQNLQAVITAEGGEIIEEVE